MKRIIEFRGLHGNQCVYGDLRQDTDGEVEGDKYIGRNCHYLQVNPETVGQFTGLTDANGVKIFEGDIILSKSKNDFIVSFEHGEFTATNKTAVKGNTCIWERHNWHEGKVIGNIHEK